MNTVIRMNDTLREKVRKYQARAQKEETRTPTVAQSVRALWHIGWITTGQFLAYFNQVGWHQ